MKNFEKQTDKRILIWDIPTRIFHWGLVAAMSWSWFSIEVLEDMQQHFWAGYTVLSLLIFRLFWGFFGSFYVRFLRLFFKPSETVEYVKAFATPTPKKYPGHNPLGSLAVLAMLLVVAAQVSTGFFSSDEYFFGPLAGLVESGTITQLTDLHHRNFQLIQVLVGLHIIAIIVYRFFKKERLVSAMIHGKKDRETLTEPLQPAVSNRIYLALVLALISVAIVYVVVNHIAEPVELRINYY